MVKIYFADLQIDRLSKNSGLFTGNQDQHGWLHQEKTNDAFGRNSGEQNRVNWNQSLLVDSDFIDIHNKRNDKRNESG